MNMCAGNAVIVLQSLWEDVLNVENGDSMEEVMVVDAPKSVSAKKSYVVRQFGAKTLG